MKSFTLIFLLAVTATAQPYNDRAKKIEAPDEQIRIQALLNPLIAKAKATYPSAKRRFNEGLPKGQKFSVTTRLYAQGVPMRFEQVFVRVLKSTSAGIDGYIISDPMGGVPFKNGDKIKVADMDVVDWCIVREDGTEEGNLCGKAMDAYQEENIVMIYVLLPGTDGKFHDSAFAEAMSKQGQDMEEILNDDIKEAGRAALAKMWVRSDLEPNCVTGVLFNVRNGTVTVKEKKAIKLPPSPQEPGK